MSGMLQARAMTLMRRPGARIKGNAAMDESRPTWPPPITGVGQSASSAAIAACDKSLVELALSTGDS
jgi:hypothetical protein